MLAKPNGTIYLKEFDSNSTICKISDGSAIESSYYSLTEVSDLEASVILNSKAGKVLISFETDPVFFEGESVIYVDSEDIERHNKIIGIGRNKKYQLNEYLGDGITTGSDITIFREFVKIDFTNIPEGVYFIKPSNEMLIIRESWADPFISYSVLTTILPDFKNLKESEIKEINDRARDLIYSDIISYEMYFDTIFDADLVVLKQNAILYLYATRFQSDTDRDLRTEYRNSLYSFTQRFKVLNSGQAGNYAPVETTPEKITTGSFSL